MLRSRREGVFVAWPEGLKAMLAVDAACDAQEMSSRLLELVRLWCSILNDCAFCITMHGKKAALLGVPEALVEELVERRNMGGLGDDERAAMAYAGALTVLAKELDAKIVLAVHFSPQQIVVLTYVVAQINAWNRLTRADGV